MKLTIPYVWVAAAVLTFASRAGAAPEFVRGDCNADGGRGCDITDPVFLLLHLFSGEGEVPPCLEACNANDDGALDLTDAVYVLAYCFQGGSVIPPPYPACGEDPTPSLPCGAFASCLADCAAQDARGVGPCDAIVGIFWDGRRCRWESGCSCEGADCDEAYESLEECYTAHGACPTPCDEMSARGVGACRMLLGWSWDGRACRQLSGCECEGGDCADLYPSADACLAATTGCPPECSPMDVREVGNCEPVHGWYWNGSACQVLSGCECEGSDCGDLFRTPDDCAAAHGACR